MNLLWLPLLGLGPQEAPPDAAPLTWETLEARFDAEAKSGFSGAALVVHDGKVVLDRAYGLANREEKIAATKDTVFAIGSTPIDFTKAGILLLAEEKKLALDEALPAFFADVPEAKRAITVAMLMNGRSGLPDFHDLPSDRDPDHGWIDRAEAVKRILGLPLLFEPGQGDEHSHAAWVLLAAIVEVRSGKTYPEFTRERLLGPAGMKDTGFFGVPIPKERLAIGYGEKSDGETNAAPWWGPTSWLVMGSGGMVSTTGDLARWLRALREGRVLPRAALERYWSPPGALLAGGDMYGFEIAYTEGPRSFFVVVSNSIDRAKRPDFQRLVRDLHGLVEARPARKFSLGVEFAVEHTERGFGVTVKRTLPGSAAERDGLKAGDEIVAIGGEALGDDVMDALGPYLDSGQAIPFTVLRGGERIDLAVKPNAR
jgi:CubicO group peptidase (beta-lactamase class C family)